MKRFALLVALVALLSPSYAGATGSQPPPVKCPCCVDLDQRIDQLELVFNQRITVLEQRITVLESRVEQQNNWINEVNNRVSITINRIEALSCQSDRVYTYRLRTQVGGVPIVRVLAVTVAPEEPRDDGLPRGLFSRNDEGRFVITADYRGITAPKLQFRTSMTRVELADGREVDLVQYVRICGPSDGEPNDTPAQDRAGD